MKEVAQHAGMSASKAHFYMVSFKRVGLVTQQEVTGHYALGRYAFDLCLSALRRLDLRDLARGDADAEFADQRIGVPLGVG